MLLSVVQAKLAKAKGGMSWVISGLDEHGQQVVDDCLAAEMRELEAVLEQLAENFLVFCNKEGNYQLL